MLYPLYPVLYFKHQMILSKTYFIVEGCQHENVMTTRSEGIFSMFIYFLCACIVCRFRNLFLNHKRYVPMNIFEIQKMNYMAVEKVCCVSCSSKNYIKYTSHVTGIKTKFLQQNYLPSHMDGCHTARGRHIIRLMMWQLIQ